MKSLDHVGVMGLGFLDFLSHGFLFGFILLYELSSVFDLGIYMTYSLGKGVNCFLFGLIDEDSANLLVDFGVFVSNELL